MMLLRVICIYKTFPPVPDLAREPIDTEDRRYLYFSFGFTLTPLRPCLRVGWWHLALPKRKHHRRRRHRHSHRQR